LQSPFPFTCVVSKVYTPAVGLFEMIEPVCPPGVDVLSRRPILLLIIMANISRRDKWALKRDGRKISAYRSLLRAA